ncbi:MAG: hypothetical protein MSA31_00975, partial [Bacteroidales bacterium]|nr:hypothetical protein [Bacteroidales bacterium]
VFDRLFEEAEIAKFTPTELREYEDSRKAYRDLKNSLDTALRDGFMQGMEQGMAQGLEQGMAQGMEKGMAKGIEKGREEGRTSALLSIAQEMKNAGLGIEHIQRFTGLPEGEIEKL